VSSSSPPDEENRDEDLDFLTGNVQRPPANFRERGLLAVGHLLRARQAAYEAQIGPPDELELAGVWRMTEEPPPRRARPVVRMALAAALAGLAFGGLVSAELGLTLHSAPAGAAALLGQDVVIPLGAAEQFASSDDSVLPIVDLRVQVRDPLAWADALMLALVRADVPVRLRVDGAQRSPVLEATLPGRPGAALTEVLRQAHLPVKPGAILRLTVEQGAR
jgi:hypothetical protein